MTTPTFLPHTRKHYWEWQALRGLKAYLGRDDIDRQYARLRRLVPLLQTLLVSERRWAHRNLQLVYGHAFSEAERHRMVRLVFENILSSHLDGFLADRFRFRETDRHHLQEALQQGRGVIACSIHIGCWEPALKRLAELCAPTPTAIVYRHANNPLNEEEFARVRESYGVEWIRRDQPRQILDAVRKKKVLGLMVDINTREGGVTAPFLGMPAQCPSGPARLAMRFGLPIVPMLALREAPGVADFQFFPPIEPPRNKQPEEKEIVRVTAQLNDVFQPIIHRHAEQYNWLHARWRTRKNGQLWSLKDDLAAMQATRLDPLGPYPPVQDRVRSLVKVPS